MRTVWVLFNIVFWTVILAGGGLILSIFEWRGKIMAQVAHTWSKFILAAAGIKYSVIGLENIDPKQNYMFAGNHESALDIPLAFAGIKHHLVSISKIELKWIPIFGWGMQAGKHIFVNRKDSKKAVSSLNNAAKSLEKNPRSIMVFPEGTRSRDGKIHQFKKGGLLLAIKAQLPVVPVALCGTRDVVLKGAWKLESKPVELIIGKPIETKGMTYDDRDTLTNNVYKKVIQLKTDWEKSQ